MDENELAKRLTQYSFYHIIPLTPTLKTPGVERHVSGQQKVLRALRGIDFKGKRVLDVGCRDGLYSFEAEKGDAREIIGIDNNLSRGAVELVIPWLGSKVRMVEMNLLALSPASFGTFDIVIFAGVLYHLRFPFQGLDVLSNVLLPGGLLVLETAVFADENRHALLYCPAPTDSPYDTTSVSFFNMKGLGDTLGALGLQVEAAELEHKLAPDPTRERLPIDRVVLVCRQKTTQVQNEGERYQTTYWKSVHRTHSG
jgi:SAM-dependent methyltransferase